MTNVFNLLYQNLYLDVIIYHTSRHKIGGFQGPKVFGKLARFLGPKLLKYGVFKGPNILQILYFFALKLKFKDNDSNQKCGVVGHKSLKL